MTCNLKPIFITFCSFLTLGSIAQVQWINVDSLYAPLPSSMHVFRANSIADDGKPSIAYYVEADLGDKKLKFVTDTSNGRRLTPKQFYDKNQQPLVVVNTTFFSFATNKSNNLVIKDGSIVANNLHSIPAHGKDTLTYRHPLASAIGISKKRKADVAWTFADSLSRVVTAFEDNPQMLHDSSAPIQVANYEKQKNMQRKWKMQAAVGGGPVLVQDGRIRITNNEEWKFIGKAINDKHPRTAMGYTADHKLIILAIEGRHPGVAEGASLSQEARMLLDLHCREALNLDGGGSSCLLVNGKETIRVSDGSERPVPAVMIIKQ